MKIGRSARTGRFTTVAQATRYLARGTFPAPFLLAAMAAMEEGTIKLEDV